MCSLYNATGMSHVAQLQSQAAAGYQGSCTNATGRPHGCTMAVKSGNCLPREARPSSGMVVRPRAFSWSGMAGKALGSSPKEDALGLLVALPVS